MITELRLDEARLLIYKLKQYQSQITFLRIIEK